MRTLNTTIIERLKDTGQRLEDAEQKLEDAEQSLTDAQQKLTDAQQKLEDAEQRLIKSEEQKELFIRTYTNMSIQMLKLEEKVAKYEGRVF